MPGRKHGSSVKDDKTYEALREQGASKEKAARIANAGAQQGSSPSEVGSRGGHSGSYEDWSKQDLQQRARELGLQGRSSMSKAELVEALRHH